MNSKVCYKFEIVSCRCVSVVVVGGEGLRRSVNARDGRLREMGGASSSSGQVWQGTAGRRRCCPLIQGWGGGEREGGGAQKS